MFAPGGGCPAFRFASPRDQDAGGPWRRRTVPPRAGPGGGHGTNGDFLASCTRLARQARAAMIGPRIARDLPRPAVSWATVSRFPLLTSVASGRGGLSWDWYIERAPGLGAKHCSAITEPPSQQATTRWPLPTTLEMTMTTRWTWLTTRRCITRRTRRSAVITPMLRSRSSETRTSG